MNQVEEVAAALKQSQDAITDDFQSLDKNLPTVTQNQQRLDENNQMIFGLLAPQDDPDSFNNNAATGSKSVERQIMFSPTFNEDERMANKDFQYIMSQEQAEHQSLVAESQYKPKAPMIIKTNVDQH